MNTLIDLNSDLGEGYGPWHMGDNADMLGLVTSANIACGGHASDPETMFATLSAARARGVVIGAHPGYADRIGFGRRVIPMSGPEIERMVATQIGALMGAAALAGAKVAYVKAHGALANLAADERAVADAIAKAVKAVSPDLALLAISGTELVSAGAAQGLAVYSEVFADRTYLPNGRLTPRSRPGSVIQDADTACARLLEFLTTGLMPTLDAAPIPLVAHSVCVHGDTVGAVAMARKIRQGLTAAGIRISAFLGPDE